ncbi:MAG: microcin C transport system ATP-binding protein [Cellvibrionaceae bacterium]|jgi:microcin C transport system ATP-binding protein
MALLSVKNLSISFHQGKGESSADIVNNISFDIGGTTDISEAESGSGSGEKGYETVALVGESGSGKSLTAHAIMRLLPYPAAFHPGGHIIFEDRDLLTLPDRTMRDIRGSEIGMIFQEPMNALNPLHNVGKQIGEILKVHRKLSVHKIEKETLNLLRQVHIKDPGDKLKAYPHQLSGGQRQRVMIAMALANRPKLLIADEPTTALDVTIQKEILDLLKELQREFKMSILLITHDLGVVKYSADRVLVMQRGELVESGTTQALFSNPQHGYTKKLIDNRPKGHAVELPTNIHELPSIMSTESLCVSFPKSKPLFGRCKDFFHALKNINITLPKGSTLGIIGESGSGKSTLALAMLRLIQSSGNIKFENKSLNNLNENEIRPLRSDMQIVFQDPFASLSPRMSIEQIIREGLVLHSGLSDEGITKQVIDIMNEVGLDPTTRHRYPHEFSGGQRQRIAIARALVLDPKILFLDEPTSALDRTVQMQVINLLRELQLTRGISYIFISHDIHVIKALSHQIAVMKAGEIVEFGDTKSVLNKPQHTYTQTLFSATLD